MIWGLRVAAGLALAWIVYLASPFMALHALGRAVEEGNVAAIQRRVNFRGIRVSLTRQIVAAYVDEVGGSNLSAGERQLAVKAGMEVAEPIVQRLLSPELILDLLDDGWPQKLAAPQSGPSPEASPRPSGENAGATQPGESVPSVPIGRLLRINSVQTAYRIYARSELRGFRNVLISLPPGRPLEDRFRLRMRLSGWTWKLISLELPGSVLSRLMRRIPEPLLKRGDATDAGFARLARSEAGPGDSKEKAPANRGLPSLR